MREQDNLYKKVEQLIELMGSEELLYNLIGYIGDQEANEAINDIANVHDFMEYED